MTQQATKTEITTSFQAMMIEGATPPVDPASIDWEKIGFSPLTTAFVGGAVAGVDGAYEPFRLAPSGELRLSPSATVLNYGQALFEGLKARRGVDGRVRIFRLKANAARMRLGAERFMLAPVPEELFEEAVVGTVRANLDYVPPLGKGSLYIRPLLMGTGRTLSLVPSPRTLFMVYVNPVGHYFKGLACIAIRVEDRFQRAADLGVGRVKAAGNYAPCFKPVAACKDEGFSDLLFLDHEGRRIEEVGSANLCAVKGKKLFAADSPSVLQGITRDSVAVIAAKRLGLEVEVGRLELDRVLGLGAWKAEGKADELFCTGTAAIVSPIGRLRSRGEDYRFSNEEPGPTTRRIYEELDGIQTGRLPDDFGWTTIVDGSDALGHDPSS